MPGEIRKLKDSCKDQIDREHETPVDGDATGGEHSSGSAVAYEGTSTPANRPDGATALADNAIDRGRLWLDDNSDPPVLKRWDGSAWETLQTLGGYSPAAYAGEESVTLPNGLIFKAGVVAQANPATITFAAAFPNAILSANVKSVLSGVAADPTSISAYSTTQIVTYTVGVTGPGTPTSILWQAWGY